MHFVGIVFADTDELDHVMTAFDENLETEPFWSTGDYINSPGNGTKKRLINYLAEVGVLDDFMIFTSQAAVLSNGQWLGQTDYTYPSEPLKMALSEWDGHDRYRFNKVTGNIECESVWNPNGMWDWYEVGGRWQGFITTRKNEVVDFCTIGEIDLTRYPYGTRERPYYYVYEGEWHEAESWDPRTSKFSPNKPFETGLKDALRTSPPEQMIHVVDSHR